MGKDSKTITSYDEFHQLRDFLKDAGSRHMSLLQGIADNDVRGLTKARESYGDSWKKRGGVGAFMMLARKWDRIEEQVEKDITLGDPDDEVTAGPYDILSHLAIDMREEGLIDDIRDLRRYLFLVEAEVLARKAPGGEHEF